MSFGELSNIFFVLLRLNFSKIIKIAAFCNATKTKCGIIPTWITPHGLFKNEYSAAVQYQVLMDGLFYDSQR